MPKTPQNQMTHKNIRAIILSAGTSSRMRGDFKPLLPLGQMTLLERGIRLFKIAGISDIQVVIGHRHEELIPLLKQLEIPWIVNHQYADGMFSSVLTGISSLEPDHEAFFILPVDIPLIRPQTVIDLLTAYQETFASNPSADTRAILYPNFMGKRGHPPLISSAYAQAITHWSGEGGLRGFLQEHESLATDVSVADECILLDLDTPADYQKLKSRYAQYHIPTEQECMALMTEKFGLPEPILRHCQAVARLSLHLAEALNRAGGQLNLELIQAAGLLHDLAKGKSEHATVGANILKDMGYPEVAEVVESHMDITICDADPVSANEVVYLADKLLLGTKLVPIETRFAEKMRKYAHDLEIRAAIELRQANAFKIRQRIEKAVGKSLGVLF